MGGGGKERISLQSIPICVALVVLYSLFVYHIALSLSIVFLDSHSMVLYPDLFFVWIYALTDSCSTFILK